MAVGRMCQYLSMSSVELLERRIYSMPDADRYLGLHSGTARRWIDGYSRRQRDYPPVIRAEQTGDETVSWGEFVEARLLSEFRGQGVSLQKLRPAIENLRAALNTPYPLAASRTLLDVAGRELVMRIQEGTGLDRRLALVVVRSGQMQLSEPAQHFVDRATFAKGWVANIAGDNEGTVLIDPLRAMGRPAVRSVPTEVLAEGFRAGESTDTLADLYDLTADQVERAIRFEMRQASASAA